VHAETRIVVVVEKGRSMNKGNKERCKWPEQRSPSEKNKSRISLKT
jgi:hypothetical protein